MISHYVPVLLFCLFFFHYIETWILYSGTEQGVSKVVREAYKYYEDMEFKTKSEEKEISDPDRHVKLISMAGNEVQIIVKLYSTKKSLNEVK